MHRIYTGTLKYTFYDWLLPLKIKIYYFKQRQQCENKSKSADFWDVSWAFINDQNEADSFIFPASCLF